MSDLDRLFYWRGIAPDFYNFRGELTQVPIENRIKLLDAMGVDSSTAESINKEIFDLDIKPWLSWLPEMEVISSECPGVEINFCPEELESHFCWALEQSGKCVLSGEFTASALIEVGDYCYENKRYSKRLLDLPDLLPGYYDVLVTTADKSERTSLAVHPTYAFQPEQKHNESEKLWGFVVQLYTLRSKDNWGIGDFSDLLLLIEYSASLGVDIIGLNPFHVLQADLEHDYSPYSPSDRRFLSPLYIDVTLAPGYVDEFKPFELVNIERDEEHVRYNKLRDIKYSALLQSFDRYLNSNDPSLAKFVEHSDDSLIDFINHEAANSWQQESLPVNVVNRASLIQSLYNFKQELASDFKLAAFYCYLQWVASNQLEACQHRARELGMSVGLVRDLAVGASGGGAEVQTNSHLFCSGAAIGAPPDPLALTGQNWGIPPLNPVELRRTGFRHFISLLRSNMASCGALRIDHAMSLLRLWWCPPGATADHGAYVYYSFKEMLGLLCLESHLNECVIIAEDLGIVPEEFRDAIAATKLFSNRVFYFEKWSEAEFKHPSDYDAHALAMLDNHDVPTVTSWWNGSDLVLRDELNLLEPGSVIQSAQSLRREEKINLYSLLEKDGLLPKSWQGKDVDSQADQALINAITLFGSQAKSKFFILQIEDLLLMETPVNVPGTYLEHKNWSRKLNRNIEDIFTDDGVLKALNAISVNRAK